MPAHLPQGPPRQTKNSGFTNPGERKSKPRSKTPVDPRAPSPELSGYR